MIKCRKCNDSGKISVIGKFVLDCACQEPQVSTKPTRSQEGRRSQPTAKEFPKGAKVRFKHDHQSRFIPKMVPKGTIATVARSGDCDPYPHPYARLIIPGRQKLQLMDNPKRHLDLVGATP